MKINRVRSQCFGLISLSFLFFLANCRGEVSDKPPLHLNPNMDFQPRENVQGVARPLPEGTVAFGHERDVVSGVPNQKFINQDSPFGTGKDAGGQFLKRIPMSVDRDLLVRGRGRFDIYCAACHDRAGTSQSIVVKRGLGIPPPPDLASENLVVMPDGQIYQSIKFGIRNMPGYGAQMEPMDIWAVVAYVRAIQASRTAGSDQVPEKIRSGLDNSQQ